VRLPMATILIVTGLVLGFAVTVSPSWLSLGSLGATLFVAGLTGVLIASLGRLSDARRERWHAAGPWLMVAGGTLWLALRPPYVRGVDLVSLGFILALTGLLVSALAAYLVAPWRGRGVLRSWLRPEPARSTYRQDDDPTVLRPEPARLAYRQDDDPTVLRPKPARSTYRQDDDPTVLLPPVRDDPQR